MSYCSDSACNRCVWYIVTEENPDAENGPGTILYEECGQGYDENLGTPGGCKEWEEG